MPIRPVLVAGCAALCLQLLTSACEEARAAAPAETAEAQDVAASGGAAPAAANAPAAAPVDEIARLRALVEQREREISELKRELGREQQRRFDRERSWHEYNRWLARLPLGKGLEQLRFPEDPALFPPESKPAEPAQSAPAPDARALESARLVLRLNAMLRAEGVREFDILEAGGLSPADSPTRWLGPVVLRWIDDDGRLAGSLSAARLRLSVARAARTLTLVLEDGLESRDGQSVPLEAGGRRIVLPQVDPDRWLEGASELIEPEQQLAARDDGRWDLNALRARFNDLLRADVSAGYWQLRELGGVVGERWNDIELLALDAQGRPQRYLFADRLLLRATGSGIEITLEDGAVLKAGRKQPFQDGRFRIVLPHASPAAWAAAGLPGLSPGPASGPAGGAARSEEAR